MRPTLQDVLAKHGRVAIAGGPRTGKTTAARSVTDRPVIATDDTKDAPWTEQPELAKVRCCGRERFVIEGVQVGRALRKGLGVDAIVIMNAPKVPLTEGQERMRKGCDKILREAIKAHPGVPVYHIDTEAP